MLQKINHTQVPNDFIDRYMGILSGNAIKVFLVVARKTIGWHKESERISNSQIMSLTGIKDVKTLNRAIAELINHKLIIKERNGMGRDIETYYEINFSADIKSQSDDGDNSGNIPLLDDGKGGKIPPINDKKGGKIPPINGKEGWKNSTHKINNNINKNNKEMCDETSHTDYSENREEILRLTELLYNKIIATNKIKKYKNNPPDLKKWAVHIERLHRIDGIPLHEIEAMIHFVYTDVFWGSVILSAQNLRDKYARLEAARAKAQKTKKQDDFEITPVVKAPEGFVSW